MILSIYVLLTVLGFSLVFLGFFANPQIDALKLTGFLFVFIIAITLITPGVDYQTGFNESYRYGNNYTGYHGDYDVNPPANALNLFHIERDYNYSTYTNRTLGIYLVAVALLGFAVVMFQIRENKEE